MEDVSLLFVVGGGDRFCLLVRCVYLIFDVWL